MSASTSVPKPKSAVPRLQGLARHGALIVSAAFALVPFIWMLSLSLKPPEEIFQPEFHLWPQSFQGLENYRIAFTAAPMFRFLLNGIFVCATIFLLQMLVCVPCAYALAKLRFRGRDTLFSAVLVYRPAYGRGDDAGSRKGRGCAVTGMCQPVRADLIQGEPPHIFSCWYWHLLRTLGNEAGAGPGEHQLRRRHVVAAIGQPMQLARRVFGWPFGAPQQKTAAMAQARDATRSDEQRSVGQRSVHDVARDLARQFRRDGPEPDEQRSLPLLRSIGGGGTP